jgi:putative ABC transport system permease protein
VMIGVAMIISLVSVAQGLKKSANDFTSQIGNNIVIAQEGNFGPPMTSNLDDTTLEQIEKIPGVKVASPIVIVAVKVAGSQRQGMISDGGSTGLVGVDPLKNKQTNGDYTKIVAGSFLSQGDRKMLVIGAKIAGDLNKKVGDLLKISYKGTEYEFEIKGIYQTDSGEDTELITTIEEARIVGSLPKYRINMITVVPENPAMQESLERRIKLTVPGVDPTYGKALASTLTTFTSTLQLATWVIAGIAAIIGGVGIMNTMVMSVMEQTKEIGILKAVGWRGQDVLSIILAESVGISAIGALFGVAIGLLTCLVILPPVFSGFVVPEVTVEIVAQAVAFALVLGVIGGFLPAKRAADMDPIEAFRSEE